MIEQPNSAAPQGPESLRNQSREASARDTVADLLAAAALQTPVEHQCGIASAFNPT